MNSLRRDFQGKIITMLYGGLAKLLGYTGEAIKSIDKIQRLPDEGIAGKQNIVLMPNFHQ
jgi:hypothetical protein